MRPLLKSGEILPIHPPVNGNKVRPGDIVLYRIGKKRLLHRVWWRNQKSLWMKDDAGSVDFHRIPERYVLGFLKDRRPLSRGWLGLFYSLVNTAFFILGRHLKKALTY